jgi:hypothetical protein
LAFAADAAAPASRAAARAPAYISMEQASDPAFPIRHNQINIPTKFGHKR